MGLPTDVLAPLFPQGGIAMSFSSIIDKHLSRLHEPHSMWAIRVARESSHGVHFKKRSHWANNPNHLISGQTLSMNQKWMAKMILINKIFIYLYLQLGCNQTKVLPPMGYGQAGEGESPKETLKVILGPTTMLVLPWKKPQLRCWGRKNVTDAMYSTL